MSFVEPNEPVSVGLVERSNEVRGLNALDQHAFPFHNGDDC